MFGHNCCSTVTASAWYHACHVNVWPFNITHCGFDWLILTSLTELSSEAAITGTIILGAWRTRGFTYCIVLTGVVVARILHCKQINKLVIILRLCRTLLQIDIKLYNDTCSVFWWPQPKTLVIGWAFSRVRLSAVTMLFRLNGNQLVDSVGLWLGSPKRTPNIQWNDVHAGLANNPVS